MDIRRVKKDSSDLTLAIPSGILRGLNADFDGDEINTISKQLEEIDGILDGFSIVNHIINRVDSSIKIDVSDHENITLAMFSDR